MSHLPPGAVKHEHTYKKGERLPDRSIADSDRKILTIEMSKPLPNGKSGQLKMQSMLT